MIQPTIVTTREVLRRYKEIIAKIRQTKQPAIVVSQKEPQVAIISLEDLETLQHLRMKHSAKNLLATAMKVRTLLKDEQLPADLSERHDFYHFEEEGAARKD
jgi:PHD/YefM family antitoxin component YafN of YafNO toxin-antitoxin module